MFDVPYHLPPAIVTICDKATMVTEMQWVPYPMPGQPGFGNMRYVNVSRCLSSHDEMNPRYVDLLRPFYEKDLQKDKSQE